MGDQKTKTNMPDENLIQPKMSAPEPVTIEPTTPEAPAPAPDEAAQASGLSESLLRLPAVQSLMAGSPPAVSGTLEEFKQRPEAKIITENKDEMLKAGFFFYRSIDGAVGVIGNGLYILPDAIKQADAAGQLASVAPSFDTVSSAVSTSGDKNPVLGHDGKVPEGFATAPAAAPPMQVSGPGQPASVQRQTATARQKNMQVGSPTSGAGAGSGTLMRSILKQPV